MDLDIHNYNVQELKDLLKLKKSYTEDDINFNSYEFKKKVMERNNISSEKKEEIISFLKLCVKVLKNDLEKKNFKKMLEESKFKKILKNQDKIIKNQERILQDRDIIVKKIENILELVNKKKIVL